MTASTPIRIERLAALPAGDLAPLLTDDERAGTRFVRRLVEEWASGANRFARPGEALFGAWEGPNLVGVCGLNADPYAGDARVGRVRRLYVLSAARRRGVGRRLVAAVVEAARGRFATLRLRTDSTPAARLYETLGFRPVPERADCTHAMDLAPAGRVTVRALAAHEIDLHRDLRLRALRDAPDSFGDPHAEAAARPRVYWEKLTRSVTGPGRHVMFVARAGPHVVGSAYGLLDHERSGAGRVGGLWVEPACRGRGIGAALLRAVLDWACARGLDRVGLWVPAHRPEALALYRRAGFRETGTRRPLPADPAREIVEMEWAAATTGRGAGLTGPRDPV